MDDDTLPSAASLPDTIEGWAKLARSTYYEALGVTELSDPTPAALAAWVAVVEMLDRLS